AQGPAPDQRQDREDEQAHQERGEEQPEREAAALDPGGAGAGRTRRGGGPHLGRGAHDPIARLLASSAFASSSAGSAPFLRMLLTASECGVLMSPVHSGGPVTPMSSAMVAISRP